MSQIQPVSSPYADLYFWKSVVSIASNVAPANKATSQLQILGDSFFCLMGFAGSTNYDNWSGMFKADGIAANAFTAYGPPRVPNNFEVFITENSTFNFMNSPIGQGAICSNGYLGTQGLLYPILFPPSTSFNFDFFNVAPNLLALLNDDPVPLEINFSMFGYNVPTQNLNTFCAAWPAFQGIAMKGQNNWLEQFTGLASA